MAFEASILREVQLFKLFDEEELRELAAQIEERHFVAGQTIFRLGDPGDAMHVVVSGRVELFIVDGNGQRALVGSAEPGDMFGEFSLLDSEPRSASAIAVQPTHTVRVDRDDLVRLFTLKPQAALDMLAVLSRRLRRTDLMLAEHLAPNANEVIEEAATLGDRIADGVARVGGSWAFINTFSVVLILWMGLNTWQWFGVPSFDPPPFIGLNLLLSTIAALQAPVIMMSQNRQDAKDRVRADIEYEVNMRAECGVRELQAKVDTMKEELIELLVELRGRR